MIADGERLKALLARAEDTVLLCAPFIKAEVLQTVLSIVPASVSARIVTRWRPLEIALGVSDLEVFDIVAERPHAELRLLDDLHAKLYRADDQCLVGSANLTATALGWSARSNIELLVPARSNDPDVALLLDRIERAERATSKIREEIFAIVNSLEVTRLEEGQNMTGESDSRRLAWLPRCAAPDKLYEMYRNANTTVVVEGTKEEGLADLRDLYIPNGLSQTDFDETVQNALLLMPAFAAIIEKIPQGVTDAIGVAHVKDARPDLAASDAQAQWRIVRDWIGAFFPDFEVAPESFITRLKPRQ